MAQRVRDTGSGNRQRAQRRMAPGGRLWAEKMLPRPARDRVAMMETPLIPLEVSGVDYRGNSGYGSVVERKGEEQLSMDGAVTIGWRILDPNGNLVEEGESVVIQVDVAEEIAKRIAEVAAEDGTNGGAQVSWPE